MSNHTKGPWETHVGYDATGYPGYFVHGFSGDEKRDDAIHAANARLIAAAPDLLEALKLIMTCYPAAIASLPGDGMERVHAAIAKAESRS